MNDRRANPLPVRPGFWAARPGFWATRPGFWAANLALFCLMLLAVACSRETPPDAITPLTGPAASPLAATTAASPAYAPINPANAADLQPVEALDAQQARLIAWLPGSEALALAGPQALSVVAVGTQTGPELQVTAEPSPFSALAVAPQGQLLAAVENEAQITVFDLQAQAPLRTLDAGDEPVTGLAFSPDGELLAATSYDRRIRLWENATGSLLETWEFPAWLTDPAFSPDGQSLAGADLSNFLVHIIDLGSLDAQTILSWEGSAGPNLYQVGFAPDWTRIAWVQRATVQLMFYPSGELGPALLHEDAVNAIAWSPDAAVLATGAAGEVDGGFSPVLTVWDPATGDLLARYPLPAPAARLAFSPDGAQLAALLTDGQAQIWAAPPTP